MIEFVLLCVCVYVFKNNHNIKYTISPILPGKSHGRRSLVGCSPWGRQSRARLSDFTFTFHFHALEKEMATHSVFLPGESQGRGSLVGCCLWGCIESDTAEATQQQQQQLIKKKFFFPRIVWLVGSQFPSQGLNLGPSSGSTESSPLDYQGIPALNQC